MKVDNISIQNFRCFKNININFNQQMNVIIGNNGMGKTAILDALSIAIGSFFLGNDGAPAPGIKTEDVRFSTVSIGSTIDRQPQYPTIIKCSGNLDNRLIEWSRQRNTEAGRTTIAEAHQIREISENLQDEIREGNIIKSLPLISYYGTGRLWAQKRKKQDRMQNIINNRFKGYTDCLSAASNEKFMLEWFKKMTYMKLQEEKEIPELTSVLKTIEQCYAESGANVTDVKVKFSVKTNQLEITFKDENGQIQIHPFHELSDGYRNTLSLVADIAYRMAMLNPQYLGDVIKETRGIVLIDEIDLHLHPTWQKKILNTLKSIFPHIQFIVTTHSPSVISSAKEDELLILNNDSCELIGSKVYGKDVNSILSEIMGTPERPDEIDRMFKHFRDLLDNEEIDKAKIVLNEIRDILGDDDNEVISSAITLDFKDNWE